MIMPLYMLAVINPGTKSLVLVSGNAMKLRSNHCFFQKLKLRLFERIAMGHIPKKEERHHYSCERGQMHSSPFSEVLAGLPYTDCFQRLFAASSFSGPSSGAQLLRHTAKQNHNSSTLGRVQMSGTYPRVQDTTRG